MEQTILLCILIDVTKIITFYLKFHFEKWIEETEFTDKNGGHRTLYGKDILIESFVDLLMLAKSDSIVLSNSGFGVTAASVGLLAPNMSTRCK